MDNEPNWKFGHCKNCGQLEAYCSCDNHVAKHKQCEANAKVCIHCEEQGRNRCETEGCGNYEQRRCRQRSRPGKDVCRFHGGGKIGKRSAGRPPQTAKYADLGAISEIADRLAQDPQLLSLRKEIAILTSRTEDLLAQYEGGRNGQFCVTRKIIGIASTNVDYSIFSGGTPHNTAIIFNTPCSFLNKSVSAFGIC